MIFGGYRVLFKHGEEPHFLQIAWPVNTHPEVIRFICEQAREAAREALANMAFIAFEQREHSHIIYEMRMYGRPGGFVAESAKPVEC